MSHTDIQLGQISELKILLAGGTLSATVSKKLNAILRYYESDASLENVAKDVGVTGGALRRWLDQFDPADAQSLEEKSRKPKTFRSSQVDPRIVTLIREYRTTSPRMGKEEISAKLLTEHSVETSASAIGRIIERECLYFADCPLHRRKRFQAQGEQKPSTEHVVITQAEHIVAVSIPAHSRWSMLKKWTVHGLLVALLLCGTILGMMLTTVTRAHAATLGAKLLVNSEAFELIDAGNGSDPIALRFGTSSNFIQFNSGIFYFSGGINAPGTISGTTLNANTLLTGSTIQGFGLFNCQGSANKITYNATTKKFLCETDQTGGGPGGTAWSNTGSLMNAFDMRYVKKSGDTMTGSLDIRTALPLLAGSGALNVHQFGSGTGAIIRSLSSVAPALALSINGSSASPHILFGYAGTFDTNLYRSTTNTLKTDGNIRAVGTISGAQLRANNMTVSGAVVYSSGNTLMQSAKGLSGQLLISQATSAPKWATPVGGMIWYLDGTQAVATSKGPQITMPFAITLSDVSLKAKGAPTGADLIYDINKDGSSIFATRPQINAGSTSGGGSAVFSTTIIEANTVLTLDVDQIGSTFAGSGVTIMLKGTRKY